ncbi:hypothetical protein MBAV_000847 [Candidatus Magnetobacterium bavaricum]|uniref:Uncharacterized protein n=1 Tax=Candidatus Magnetobacterium bavaricum TaxID=29290 RepID=A0A0F3GYB7_9BACT|nr:hypothetical protein MBAV_000847 [Candidatus Magnetobacterium bavaricum]
MFLAVSFQFMLVSMIVFDMYRPSPVPLSDGLVVKYGSNILSMISSGMPPPLSLMDTIVFPLSVLNGSF